MDVLHALKHKTRHQTKFQDKLKYILYNKYKNTNMNKNTLQGIMETKDPFNLDLYILLSKKLV